MTAIAHTLTAIELRAGLKLGDAPPDRLWLRATTDGWSLLDASGRVLFQGLGQAARRQCLEHARSRGVLAVLS
jgi:hypothetical protein